MVKGNINFEKELWDAANELLGAVTENYYKNYILPLVLVMQASEHFEVVREAIKDLLKNSNSDYYYTTNKTLHRSIFHRQTPYV